MSSCLKKIFRRDKAFEHSAVDDSTPDEELAEDKLPVKKTAKEILNR